MLQSVIKKLGTNRKKSVGAQTYKVNLFSGLGVEELRCIAAGDSTGGGSGSGGTPPPVPPVNSDPHGGG